MWFATEDRADSVGSADDKDEAKMGPVAAGVTACVLSGVRDGVGDGYCRVKGRLAPIAGLNAPSPRPASCW